MKDRTGNENEDTGGEIPSVHETKGDRTGKNKDTKERKTKKEKKDKKAKKQKKANSRSADGSSSSAGNKRAALRKAGQGRSKRIARVDTELCYGCGKCVKVCKVKAISLIPRT